MNIPQALETALQFHQAGRLADAEALYRRVLAAQPGNADALHLLGVIAHQAGRSGVAIDLIRQSIVLNPRNRFAHYNLGEACRAIGRLDEAVAGYRRALELRPDYPEAHQGLGIALKDLGRLDDAVAAFRRALELQPNFPEAHNNLGVALKARGQFDEALASYGRALRIKPDCVEALNNMGAALCEKAQFDEAIGVCRRAIGIKGDQAEAWYHLGMALQGKGERDAAIDAYRHALQIQPDHARALNNLGAALRDEGRLDEAVAAYRRSLQIRPDLPETYNNLGVALRDRGELDEAADACRRALEMRPDYARALDNLGAILAEQGHLDEAIAAHRHALRLAPDFLEAHNNLATALKDQGRIEEAIAAYRGALPPRREDAAIHSNLIHALLYQPGKNEATIAEEQRRWNRLFSEPVKQFILPHANDRSPDRRLRVGYVSPDFRDHAVGRNLLPLFQRHDRENFEIICYAGVVKPDRLTDEFRQRAHQWRNTVGIRDDALAEMIRRDGVDILVDLSLHTAGNRLPMFARKPAPIQVSFAGYPGSTGLEAIEYRISDRYLEAVSADQTAPAREQFYLIDSFWCYDPCEIEVDVNKLPASESGRVTFGCLNNFCKVNEHALRLWARALGALRDSRMVIWSRPGGHRERTLEFLEREGVEARRVEFAEACPRREYLQLYHRLDIVLDTFPYNGHTTSLDALWMGVPVVSLAGRTPLSRAGLSQLSNLGLAELVAHSEWEYASIAQSLASNLPRLAELRSTLRDRMKNSVLTDATQFARGIETAYRSMWKRRLLAKG